MKYSDVLRQVNDVEKKAHAGQYGMWRRQFCRDYSRVLNQILAERHRLFLETIEAKGETITCRKGCANCCCQHIEAYLAHGIYIADYLYANEKLLHVFLKDYEHWYSIAGPVSGEIDLLQHQAAAELKKFDSWWFLVSPLLKRYFRLATPCPFLKDGACAIYSVRPGCCASHYSVNPPELCSVNNVEGSPTYDLILRESDQQKLGALAPAELFIYQMTMPVLVYRLLTEGLMPMLDELGIRNVKF
jgi:Fe-S-cluster containining protein